jgi:hypothetical protein
MRGTHSLFATGDTSPTVELSRLLDSDASLLNARGAFNRTPTTVEM